MVKTVELPVKGMHCAGCERSVSFLLAALDGVEDAEADRAAEKVTVAYDDERVTEQDVRAEIERAGYQVG